MLEGKDLALIVDGVGVSGICVSVEDFDAETLEAWRELGGTENVLLLWRAEFDGVDASESGPSRAASWGVIDRSKISGVAIRGDGRTFQKFKKLKERKASSED